VWWTPEKRRVSLASEPVVRDYPDVFPEDLLGLPPHREIDFAIELESGMSLSRRPLIEWL